MAKSFTGVITLGAGTATRLSDALAAAGYAGSMVGAFLQIDDLALTDLRMGDSSSVSASVGVPISAVNGGIFQRTASGKAIDPGAIWLFSTAGGNIAVVFTPY
jgi:hypothetical protein